MRQVTLPLFFLLPPKPYLFISVYYAFVEEIAACFFPAAEKNGCCFRKQKWDSKIERFHFNRSNDIIFRGVKDHQSSSMELGEDAKWHENCQHQINRSLCEGAWNTISLPTKSSSSLLSCEWLSVTQLTLGPIFLSLADIQLCSFIIRSCKRIFASLRANEMELR